MRPTGLKGLILAAIVTLPAGVAADRIILVNGREIEGRIVQEEPDRIQVEARGIQTWLSRDRIAEVIPTPEYTLTLEEAATSFRRGDAVGGIEKMRRALDEGASTAAVNSLIEDYDAAISAVVFRSDERARRELRLQLRRLVAAEALNTRTLILTARHLADLEDNEGALQALQTLSARDLAHEPERRHWVLTFMRDQVRGVLNKGDFEGALELVERIRRLSGDADGRMLPIAHMARAAAAREQNQFPLAMEIILEELREEYPEIARNRMRATLEELEAWATSPARQRQAREVITRIEEEYPVEYAATLNRLVAREAGYLLHNDRPEEALALIESVPDKLRSSKVRDMNLDALHHSELRRIGHDDPLELLKHGRWCLENDLVDEALRVFNRTRDNSNLREISDQLIVAARRQRDTRLIEEARAHHDDGNPSAVLERTQQILTNPGVSSELSKEAERLGNLAQQSLRRDSERRPFEAIVLYQRAERAYFAGSLTEALNLLRILIRNFPDTPAAGQATGLLPDVLRAIELAYLEGNVESLPDLPDDLPLGSLEDMDRLGSEVTRLIDALESGG